MEEKANPFHWADYLLFAATIIISLVIGIYYALSGGKQKTTSEYLSGNRQMSTIPVAVSLMVTFESSIMVLGSPAEVYVYGLQIIISMFVWTLMYIISIRLVVPMLYPLKITSTYEYLEMRFKSHAVRILGTIIGICYYVAYMGIVLFGPAIALEAVIGFPLWTSIVVVAGVAIIYTAIGGLKAVIWTDVFQCVIMLAGFFAILIKATVEIGGVGKTWEMANEGGRLNFFNFDPDVTVRHTFWCLTINSVLRSFGFLFNQATVQRIGATPSEAAAHRALYMTAPAFLITVLIACVEGIVAYSYFDHVGCDPLESKQIRDPNQIIPFMVMQMFRPNPGMLGLFMASLFSASLSTLSSGLSSLSALTWTDLIKPHIRPVSEFTATLVAKVTVVFFGGIAILIAFLISMIGGTLVQITVSILSAFVGPLTGLFMLAGLIPWANAKGSIIGTILGVAFTFWISIGQMTTPGSQGNTKLLPASIENCPAVNSTMVSDWSMYNDTEYSGYSSTAVPTITTQAFPEITGVSRLYTMSYQYINPLGVVSTVILGTLISLLTGANRKDAIDPRYLIPLFDRIFCYLPNKLLNILHCGMDYTEAEKFRRENGKASKDIELKVEVDKNMKNISANE